MASGQSVFNGALGWDDWIWWTGLGAIALLILLLLVCCCVCMQRAKRKGHEEALAAVQARQRLTQERERAEQRYQQAQQARFPPPTDVNNGNNGYGYSKPVTAAVPLAPPPNRRTMGPQVAANSYRQESPYQQQQQQQQFAKPYPPLPAQQAAEYQAPPRWFNASLPQQQQPISQGYEANAPRLSSHSGLSNGSNDRRRGYNQQQAAPMYPDSMRFDDPYPAGGGPDGVPFVSVTSPSASKSLKQNKKQAVKLQPADKSGQQPPPVMMPKYQSAPPVERSPTGSQGSSASVAKASVGSASTLQARIDALRSDDGDNMVHSRISVDPRGVDYSRRSGDSSSVGGALSTIQLPAMPESSYASGTARRSGLLAGSVLSSGSASITSSPRNDATTLGSARSMETFDPEAFESANSTAFSAALTRADSGRSIGSDFSHGQFEDADSLAGSSHNPAAATANANASTPGRATRTPRGTSSFDSRGSVEF